MPGKSKHGGGLEVKSAYKMKYQGNTSAFPFKSSPTKLFGSKKRKEKREQEELREEMRQDDLVRSRRKL